MADNESPITEVLKDEIEGTEKLISDISDKVSQLLVQKKRLGLVLRVFVDAYSISGGLNNEAVKSPLPEQGRMALDESIENTKS